MWTPSIWARCLPRYLFLVLVYVFDLGVVHGQVPAVGCVPHAVAAGAQQGGLPLGGHGLQGGEHRVAAAAQTLAHTQVQRPVLIDVQTRALHGGMGFACVCGCVLRWVCLC